MMVQIRLSGQRAKRWDMLLREAVELMIEDANAWVNKRFWRLLGLMVVLGWLAIYLRNW